MSIRHTVRRRLRDTTDRARLVVGRRRLPDGVDRVHHFHVRKTGGSSLNSAFRGVAGLPPTTTPPRHVAAGPYVFVSRHPSAIAGGRYFYSSSHRAAHEVLLPPNTYTVTVLRDPAARLGSHYRMLLGHRDRPEEALRDERAEFAWLGTAFADFVERIPREHRERQLAMFSETFDVDEAFERIGACDAVLQTENLDAGVDALGARLGLPLALPRTRVRVSQAPDLEPADLELARAAVGDEIVLFERLARAGVLGRVR